MKRAKTNGFTRTGNRRAMALFMAALAMGTLLTGCGERAHIIQTIAVSRTHIVDKVEADCGIVPKEGHVLDGQALFLRGIGI